MSQKMNNLKKKINAAFPLDPAPSGLFDPTSHFTPERQNIEAFFLGKKWNEITRSYLTENIHDPNACLAMLSREAAIYYLPAFMNIALNFPEETLTDFTLYTLSPSFRNPEVHGYFLYFVSLLNIQQINTISCFVSYFIDGNRFGHGQDESIVFAGKMWKALSAIREAECAQI
jgi:hypothetical protein